MKPKASPYSFSRHGRTVALVSAVTFCVAGVSSALEYNWRTAITGDFNTPANWQVGASPSAATDVPSAADNANVGNGGTSQWTTNAAKVVGEVRAGNGGSGTIQISGGNAFSAGSTWAGRQSGTAIGTLTISGASTVYNTTTGNTLVGAGSSAISGVTGSTGVLSITSGAVFNHTPGGETFRVGDTQGITGGAFKGTLNVDAGTLNIPNSQLFVGQNATAVGEVNLSNNGSINVANNWAVIGHGGQGTLNLSGGTFTKAGANNLAVGNTGGKGVLTQTGGTLAVTGGEFYVGSGTGSTGTYSISGTSVFNVANWVTIGHVGGNGTMNITGGTITKSGANNFAVAEGGDATGLVNQSAGVLNVTGGQFFVGDGTNATAVYNLSGGSITVNNWIAVGRTASTGTLNVSGGTLTKTGTGDDHFIIAAGGGANPGLLNVTGGLVDIKLGQLWVGEGNTATATISDSGQINVSAVQVAKNNTANLGLLKLNGGTLRTGRIFGGAGNASVEFNGTNVIATANQTEFLSAIDLADIKGGGALIDSNGFNIGSGSGQALTGTGGLTKKGAGTLTLRGPDTYAGPTLVNAGKLTVTAQNATPGTYTVADAAAFGVESIFGGSLTTVSNVIVGASTLAVDLGNFGAFDTAPLSVTNALTLNGAAASTTLAVTGTGIEAPTTIPLIKYGSLGGTGGFASLKLSVPLGWTASLVNNVSGKSIDLNIVRINVPIWSGDASSEWNTTALNWREASTLSSTTFANGDPALFSDAATNKTVNLATGVVVLPTSISFDHAENYTITGAGKISGTTTVTKRGTGTVTIGTPNDYTGVTRIEAGTISVPTLPNGGLASGIGAAPATPASLEFAGGTLSYSGASTTTNRGFTLGTGAGGLEVSNAAANLSLTGAINIGTVGGGFSKKGPGTLTYAAPGPTTLSSTGSYQIQGGKVVLNGTGLVPAQVLSAGGDLHVGSVPDVPGSLQVTGTTLNVGAWLAVGRGTGGTGVISTLDITGAATVNSVNLSVGFNNGIATNVGTQILNVVGSTLNLSNQSLLAENRGSTSNVNISGASTVNFGNLLTGLGGGPALGASASTVTVSDNAQVLLGTSANRKYTSIGRNGGTGNLIIKNTASFTNFDDFTLGEENGSNGTGTLTLQDSGTVVTGTTRVGRGTTNTGLVTQTGGTFSTGDLNDIQVGTAGTGTWNLSAGTINCGGWTAIAWGGTGVGTMNITGGTFNQLRADRAILVGENGVGNLNLSNTAIINAGGDYRIGWTGTSIGTLTQTGGTNNVGKAVIVGNADSSQGTLHVSSGTFSANTAGGANVIVGNNGASKGTVNISATAVVKINNNAFIRLGSGNTSGASTFNQTGGTVTTYSDNGTTVGGTGGIVLGSAAATGANAYNLAGGVLTVPSITSAGSTSTFTFNGGLLKPTADNATFISGLSFVNVADNGANIDTNGRSITITNALRDAGGVGGLTKTGAGSLTLSGVNTYIGNTAVNTGSLTLAAGGQLKFFLRPAGVTNKITGTGTVALNGAFNIDTSAASPVTGNTWKLVDGPVNETYGATFSVVGYTKSGALWTKVGAGQKWTFSETTGDLTFEATSGSSYDSWIAGFFPGVTDPNIIGPAKDPDGDGSSNALEFALGGKPNDGSNGPKIYTFQADSSADVDANKELLMTIAVRSSVTPAFSVPPTPTATTTDNLTTYTIQGSLDLVTFSASVTAVDPVITGLDPAPSGYEYRTFSLTGSNGLGGKGFLRVRVNQ